MAEPLSTSSSTPDSEQTASMAPIIHCIRHAQGIHNAAADYTIPDPVITPFGVEQSQQLRQASFADQSKISLIVASPMSRTVQTAAVVFEPLLGPDGRLHTVLALPDLQETSDDACDTGSSVGTLTTRATEQQWPVDLSMVEEDWNDKSLSSRYSPHADALRKRARAARNYLRYRIHELAQQGDPDCHVAVITHGSFLHFFTEDWEDASLFPSTGWRNCEVRSYVYREQSSLEDVEEARLIETMDSRRARGKSHPMFSGESQAQLYRLAMQKWGEQGLQRPDQVGQTSVG